MPRQPKPFFRKQTQSWYLQLGKRQIPLGKEEDKAWQEYHAIMAGREEPSPSIRVVALLDRFLSWVQSNRAPGTYRWYRFYLQSFTGFIGPAIPISDLRPYHVTEWIETCFRGTSANYRHGAIRSVQRTCRWAENQGIIDRSPVASVEKPTPTPRETIITPEQWIELMALVKDQPFRDFLTTMWETGSRPQEVRIVESHHIDDGRWLFERRNSKGKRKRRVVYLSPIAEEITQRLAEKHPTGRLFLNTQGRPWTRNSVGLRFRRLEKKLGFPVCAYAIRHSWATRKLRAGMPAILVAKLMGHSDTRMLERVYEHLDDADLRQAIAGDVAGQVPLSPGLGQPDSV
jgi:integrase